MHINHYQIQSIDVDDTTYFQPGDWHDSLAFEGDEDATVRMSLDTFVGKMLLHCHILEHEDEGMMAVYNIRGDEGTVVAQASTLDPTCYRNSDRGYAYADGGGGGTLGTYAPTYEPTYAPTYDPTTSPLGAPTTAPVRPTSADACDDDVGWTKAGAPSKDCAWVAALPESRCSVKGDGVWAWQACRDTCSTCVYDCVTGVGDDGAWHKAGAPSKDCDWVANYYYVRSAVVGDDGRLAWEACPSAVRRCAYDDCDDDAAWRKAGDDDWKDCAWVAAAAARCATKGADGTYGFERCRSACRTCAAARDTCDDDGAWHKMGDPDRECEWVADHAARCGAKGADGTWAYDACPASCGVCA